MTLLTDLAALIAKSKARSYSHDAVVDKAINDKVKAILDDYETRIATLEGT